MNKLILLLVSALILTGCNTTGNSPVLVTQKFDPIVIPEQFVDCQSLRKKDLPSVKNLQDSDVAKLILKMNRRLKECESDDLSTIELIEARNKILREEGLLKETKDQELPDKDQS